MEQAPIVNLVSKGDLSRDIEELSHRIIGCAIEVHRQLGPGFLEKIYEEALVYELECAGIRVARQVDITVPYKGISLRGHRIDLIVEDIIIVELKAVARDNEIHAAQLLSYLRATNLPLGLLFNFNVTWLREGMSKVINERALRRAPASRSSSPSPALRSPQ